MIETVQSFKLKLFIKFHHQALSSILKLLAKYVEKEQSGIVYMMETAFVIRKHKFGTL